MTQSDAEKKAALAERKRKRLEAWRKRQQEQQAKEDAQSSSASTSSLTKTSTQQSLSSNNNSKESSISTKPKLSISFGGSGAGGLSLKKKKKKTKKKSSAFSDAFDDDGEEKKNEFEAKNEKLLLLEDLQGSEEPSHDSLSKPSKKKRRWDVESGNNGNKKKKEGTKTMNIDDNNNSTNKNHVSQNNDAVEDDLDKFMNQLNKGALGTVAVQNSALEEPANDQSRSKNDQFSGGVMTAEMLNQLNTSTDDKMDDQSEDLNDDEEEKAKRAMLAALRKVSVPNDTTSTEQQQPPKVAQLASEVQSEKQRREAHMQKLKKDAEKAQRASVNASRPDIGRIYYSDVESGIMEEAERNLDVMNNASVDALEVLAELNKKKELKAVNHSEIDYLTIRKNLYIVPRRVANLTEDEIMERRAKHKIRVRGRGAPAPVETFEECGISERIRAILKKMNITRPFAVQSQCLPCIMAGRDVIGIAKTGSGKTLAYLLPMLRHIGDQPPLFQNESGPIGLVLAPARELAVQIHSVTKAFAKQLGIK